MQVYLMSEEDGYGPFIVFYIKMLSRKPSNILLLLFDWLVRKMTVKQANRKTVLWGSFSWFFKHCPSIYIVYYFLNISFSSYHSKHFNFRITLSIVESYSNIFHMSILYIILYFPCVFIFVLLVPVVCKREKERERESVCVCVYFQRLMKWNAVESSTCLVFGFIALSLVISCINFFI